MICALCKGAVDLAAERDRPHVCGSQLGVGRKPSMSKHDIEYSDSPYIPRKPVREGPDRREQGYIKITDAPMRKFHMSDADKAKRSKEKR